MQFYIRKLPASAELDKREFFPGPPKQRDGG